MWLASCAEQTPEAPAAPEPLVPGDWEQSYTEVRDCRRSGDHELQYVRILAGSDALGPYLDRDRPFPDGAVVLKAEYADPDCVDISGFTAMRRDEGSAPDGGDWYWQKLDAARSVIEDGQPQRCVSCHTGCGVPPDGHDWTCAAP